MGLVFAAIAPHGGLAIEEACSPGERSLALSTRKGIEQLGMLFTAARPQVVVVATPHNVHISPELVGHAKADSSWQLLMLHGATSAAAWRGRVISYEAPTYYGMLTAAYEPAS